MLLWRAVSVTKATANAVTTNPQGRRPFSNPIKKEEEVDLSLNSEVMEELIVRENRVYKMFNFPGNLR